MSPRTPIGSPSPAQASAGNLAAFQLLPPLLLAMPFLDVPGLGGGAYVKPLVLPLVVLAWALVLLHTGPSFSVKTDASHRRWLLLFAWALVGDLVLPWLIDMPHDMKGQTLGGRIVRDLIGLSAGMVCWLYLRQAIQSGRQAVQATRWALTSFALLLPFLLVQMLVVSTNAALARALDSVLALVRSTQGANYTKVFGLAPEASMLADQLLSLYLPFAIAALLLGHSLFRRRLAGLSVEAWILALAIAALLFSQSRIGLVALLFLAGCAWVLAMRRQAKAGFSWRTLVVPSAVLLAVAGVLLFGGARVSLFLSSFATLDDSIDEGVWSNVTRLGSMGAGLDMALHYPLGVGTGAFPFLFEPHVPEWALISPEIQAMLGNDYDYLLLATGSEGGDIASRLPDAKALPIRVLAELGLPGLVLLAMIWTGLIRGTWRAVRNPATAASVRTVAFGSLLSLLTMLPLSFSVNSYIWVHWILVAALAAATGQPVPKRPRKSA